MSTNVFTESNILCITL